MAKLIIYIPRPEFDKLIEHYSCMSIIDKGQLTSTFFHEGKEYTVTGGVSKPKVGWSVYQIDEVIDIDKYTGDLVPLPYGEHFDEVGKGNRERSYTGLKVKFGKRTVVLVERGEVLPIIERKKTLAPKEKKAVVPDKAIDFNQQRKCLEELRHVDKYELQGTYGEYYSWYKKIVESGDESALKEFEKYGKSLRERIENRAEFDRAKLWGFEYIENGYGWFDYNWVEEEVISLKVKGDNNYYNELTVSMSPNKLWSYGVRCTDIGTNLSSAASIMDIAYLNKESAIRAGLSWFLGQTEKGIDSVEKSKKAYIRKVWSKVIDLLKKYEDVNIDIAFDEIEFYKVPEPKPVPAVPSVEPMPLLANGTKHTCDYCEVMLKLKEPNGIVLSGFLDGDTWQKVCPNCKKKHYASKAKNTFSEIPIVVTEEEALDLFNEVGVTPAKNEVSFVFEKGSDLGTATLGDGTVLTSDGGELVGTDIIYSKSSSDSVKPKATIPKTVQTEMFAETKRKSVVYTGAKLPRDAYKLLINLVPTHKNFVSGFLGFDSLLDNKKPAKSNYGIDINLEPIKEFWTGRNNVTFIEGDFLNIIQDEFHPLAEILKSDSTMLFLDPPRRGGNQLSDEQHDQLLQWCKLQRCMIMIVHCQDSLYVEELQGWHTYTYESMTHAGKATEVIWCNYPQPEELHEYTWLGSNCTERQMHKRKVASWVGKLKTMPKIQRNALVAAINEMA